MRYPMTLALTVLLAAPAVAQTAGTVQDVSVIGTTELLSNFVRATLTTQTGMPLSSVNLRQVEQEVIASGYFKSALAELRTVGGRDTLVITVVANPTIQAVDASGLTFLPAEGFKRSIGELLNVAPGATLNTQRIEQAKEALAENYQAEGFPFAPSISSDVKTNADGTVNVTFVVDEAAPISRVEVEGVTLLPASTITSIFKPLYDAKKFTPDAYYQAVQTLQQAYDDAGYLQAGVNPQTTTLQGGVLKVKVIEGQVSAIDTTDLGSPQVALQTQVGAPVTLAKIQADVRTLSNQTGKPVGFAIQPNPQNLAQVRVLFGAADITSGPVKSIAIAGNTLIPAATLQAAVKTKVGDIYSPQLAQEDFFALRDVYRQAGYEISTRDAVTFTDGTLTFNVREVKLVGYELQWQGEHRTQDRVVLRELPATGRAFNRTEINTALGRIGTLGYVQLVDAQVRSDPQNPENVTYILTVAEPKEGWSFSPGLTYETLSGWSGDVAYKNNNVFGLGHNFGLGISAQQNQAGQFLSGSVEYAIPWLDVDFLDFRTTPTSVSFGVSSGVTGNQPLLTKDPAMTVPTTTATTVTPPVGTDTGWDYSVRSTGFSVNAGRNLAKHLYANVGAGFSYNTYYLETLTADDRTVVEGEKAKVSITVKDAQNQDQKVDALFGKTDVQGLVPENGLTTRVNSGLYYDNTDNRDFPGRGLRSNLQAGYNIGRQGATPYSWTDVETGLSAYYGFGNTLEKNLGLTNKQQVFAVRANGGTIVGNAPAGRVFSVGGGSSPESSRQIRGITDGSLTGPNYFTTSAEYRYDFGLKGSVAQGLYGVVFADAGSAWGNAANPNFNLKYGVGAGVQLNLGFGGVALPSLRFDYGYSPQNGSGKFYFRLGNFW